MPITILHVDHCEYFHARQLCLYVPWRWYGVPLSLDGYVQWSRIQTQSQSTGFLFNYHQVADPISRSVHISYDVLSFQPIERFLDLGLHSIRNFPWWLDHTLRICDELNVVFFLILSNSREYIFVLRYHFIFGQRGTLRLSHWLTQIYTFHKVQLVTCLMTK